MIASFNGFVREVLLIVFEGHQQVEEHKTKHTFNLQLHSYGKRQCEREYRWCCHNLLFVLFSIARAPSKF